MTDKLPNELPSNCGKPFSVSPKEIGQMIGAGIGLFFSIILFGIVLFALGINVSSKNNNKSDSGTTRFFSIATLVCFGICAGLGYCIHYLEKDERQRKKEWPSKNDDEVCQSFITYEYKDGTATTVTDTTKIVLPQGKAIRKLKFINLKDNKFLMTVRKPDTLKIASALIQTDPIIDQTNSQCVYDVIFSHPDLETTISSAESFSATYEIVDIPSSLETYVKTRGILGRRCPRTVLYFNFSDSNAQITDAACSCGK